MKIIFSYRRDVWKDRPVDCYPSCYVSRLKEKGHEVLTIGEGHPIVNLDDVADQKKYDLLLEMDNGRGQDGKIRFQKQTCSELYIPSVLILIDSHGYPDLHKSIAPSYSHVFFAVWSRRDLFLAHQSAHWLPNTTDPEFFFPAPTSVVDKSQPGREGRRKRYTQPIETVGMGFFGSKGGLFRADIVKEVCDTKGISYDIRQVGKAFRHKWPATCHAMQNCRTLFNKGQKHDGPNQRVMESMAVKKLLYTDLDDRDGMSKLFEEGKHFLGYRDRNELEEKIDWTFLHPDEGIKIAKNGYEEVLQKHCVSHRIDSILEVVNN